MVRNLSAADLDQLTRHGVPPAEAQRQLGLLREPPPRRELVRPCRVGDGILRLDEEAQRRCVERFERSAPEGRWTKMVPASGAASRMFKTLLAARGAALPEAAALEPRAQQGDEVARDVLRFAHELPRFPFYEPLRRLAVERGLELEVLRSERLGDLLGLALDPEALDLAELPKGLLPFHRYPEEVRTAFSEHLVEAQPYLRGGDGRCRLHFTVTPEHRERFERELAAARERHGRQVRFEVGFSIQEPATDTLAITPSGEPFRTDDGELLLRPGGHGALLHNLGAMAADLVFLKNIDNVLPEHRQELVVHWQKVLGGLLLERLDQGGGQERPLRVCGVVENLGEPGGGPFWVRGTDGRESRQIVEHAEVADDPEQQEVFASSTHFNPVQLACSLRAPSGEPFPLDRFVDPEAVFLASKSHQGRPLVALERPGLWNGAMAGWQTELVEVPAATFAPVKTVFDLLRPAHQPPPR